MTPPAVANGSLTGTPELISGEANAVNIRVADIKIIQTHTKIIHDKNYKYTPTDAINACVTASFILSLVEVGLTPYLLHRNMWLENTPGRHIKVISIAFLLNKIIVIIIIIIVKPWFHVKIKLCYRIIVFYFNMEPRLKWNKIILAAKIILF